MRGDEGMTDPADAAPVEGAAALMRRSGRATQPPSELLSVRWFVSADPSPKRRSKHAIADDLRAVVADVPQLDTDAVDVEELEELRAAVADVRMRLARMPMRRRHGHGASGFPDTDDGKLFERSPFTGRSNPLAAPLVVTFDEQVTRGHAAYSDAYEGPAGCVHGGHVVAAFDDLLSVAQIASGSAGFTATLTVRLEALTPLHSRIDYEGWVDRVEGRKIFVHGRSTLGEKVLATAEGIFISPT